MGYTDRDSVISPQCLSTVDRTFCRLLLAGAIAGEDRIEEASGYRLKGLRLIAKVGSVTLIGIIALTHPEADTNTALVALAPGSLGALAGLFR